MRLEELKAIAGHEIYQRGLSYFQAGAVISIQEVDNGLYELTVSGNQLYKLKVHLSDGQLHNWHCSCPYDHGDICKHVVAAALMITHCPGGYEDLNREVKAKKPAKPTVRQEIHSLLEKISREELSSFVENLALLDTGFRTTLRTSFIHLIQEENKALYKNHIREHLQFNWDDLDYYGNPNTEECERFLNVLYLSAHQKLVRKKYMSVLWIATAIIEEIEKVIDEYDYVDHELESWKNRALELISALAEMDLPEDVRTLTWQECLKLAKMPGPDYNNLKVSIYSVLIALASTDEEAEMLLKRIEKDMKKAYGFFIEQWLMLKLKLIHRLKGTEAASEFVDQNLDYPEFLDLAITAARDSGEYEYAKRLASRAVTLESVYSSSREKWRHLLLEIALETGDTEGIRTNIRSLIIEFRKFGKVYLETARENLTDSEWLAFRDEIIQDVGKNMPFHKLEIVTQLYVFDDSKDSLMKWLSDSYYKGHISLESVCRTDKHLLPDYLEGLLDIYEHGICHRAELAGKRKEYEEICNFLGHMRKIGGRERAEEIIEVLRESYPRRRSMQALLDELSPQREKDGPAPDELEGPVYDIFPQKQRRRGRPRKVDIYISRPTDLPDF